MSARPNFTTVQHLGGQIVVSGTSNAHPFDDIIVIHVHLSQKGHSVHEPIHFAGDDWSAVIPAEGFTPGPAVAVGVEVRRENATTTTWTEPVEIPEPPD